MEVQQLLVSSPWHLLSLSILLLVAAGLLASAALLRERMAVFASLFALCVALQLAAQLQQVAVEDSLAGLPLATAAALLAAGLLATMVQQCLLDTDRRHSRKLIRSLQLATLLLAGAAIYRGSVASTLLPAQIFSFATLALYLAALYLAARHFLHDTRRVGTLALALAGAGLFALKNLVYSGNQPGGSLAALALLEAVAVIALALYLCGRKRLESRDAQLAQLQHQQAVATLAPLLDTSRHDLRAPLTDIIGLAELISDQPLDKQQRNQLASLVNTAHRALHNINTLFSYKPLPLENDASLQQCDPEALVDECFQYYRLELDTIDAEIVVNLDPGLPQMLFCRASTLRQLLLAVFEFLLVDRQLRSLLIDVRVTAGESLNFAFHSPALAEYALQPSPEAAEPTSLATARALSLQSNGMLRFVAAAGEQGQGTQASNACLQLAFPARVEPDRAGQSQAPHSLHGRRVLLVDDSAVARKVLGDCLDRWEMQVSYAATAAEARAVMLNAASLGQHIDVAIIDYKLPDATGLQLVAELIDQSSLGPMPALVMVSSSASAISPRSARNHGIHHILEKPVMAATLQQTLLKSLLLHSSMGSAPQGNGVAGGGDLMATDKLRVLLVEDELISRKVSSAQIARQGWQCDTASSGKEAIARFRERDYDLVLLDCQLPDLSGFDVAGKIREIDAQRRARGRPATRLVSVSADDDPALAGQSVAAGFDAHRVKPIDRHMLLELKTQFGQA